MIINEKNCHIANKAMASVLLLYYHLINEGGFTNDQTVYIDSDDFDGFSFIDTKVKENKMNLGIDESFLREGAIIYLLCELNDMVSEYEEDYLSQEFTKKIINSISNRKTNDIPEVNRLLALVQAGEKQLKYPEYASIQKVIYKKYVFSRFQRFLV
ncbi:MAG: hypothetical protein GY936_20320 [Ignavibacteriae bacterium]|nr:hypothetical protein [Ignavibacteriota bacterium]